jgi:hypothetical protein
MHQQVYHPKRPAKYVSHNTEARSCVAVGRQYYVICVFVSLGIEYALRIRQIVIYTIFAFYPINATIIETKARNIMCVLIVRATCLKDISF